MPTRRFWVACLIVVNLLGSLWGFNWYYWQLKSTPLYLWPVVPDSPGSTLLFSFFLIGLWFGRRWPWFEGIVSLAMMKYGFWTVLVMGHYWLTARTATWESVYLSASHLGMAVEAMLFLLVYRPAWPWGLLGAAWLYFNDWMDYFSPYLTHPNLPLPEYVNWVAQTAVGLTTASLIIYFVLNALSRRIVVVAPNRLR